MKIFSKKKLLYLILLVSNFVFSKNSNAIALVPKEYFNVSVEINDSIYYCYAINTKKAQIKTTISNAVGLIAKEYVRRSVVVDSVEKVLSSSNVFKNLKNILKSQKSLAVVFISNKELAISTPKCLFYFNILREDLKPVIKGMTFSSKMYFINNKLITENKNGIFIINYMDNKNIINAHETSEASVFSKKIKKEYVYLTLVLLLAFSVYSYCFLKKSKQLNTVFFRGKNKPFLKGVKADTTVEDINKDAILKYIEDNISTVSISDICDNFEISTRLLYKKLAPDKPGTLITNMRKNKLKHLIETETNINEASKLTGFSIHHIKKIKAHLSSI